MKFGRFRYEQWRGSGRASNQKRRPLWFSCAGRSIGVDTAQNATYQAADKGKVVAGAAVAGAIVATAAIVERSAGVTISDMATPDVTTPVARNMTGTGISTISAGRPAPRISARCVSAHCMSAHCMSAAGMTTGMVGSQRIRRHGHATDGDRGSESEECSMKHLILQICTNKKLF